MHYHRSDPKSDDQMWHLEAASVADFCTGEGIDPGAGTRTMDAQTICYDLRPADPTVREGNAVALPVTDNCVDYVVNFHLLEHLSDPRAAIAEWLRIVKPGGHVCMVIPDVTHTQGQNSDPTPHLFEWTPRRFVVEVLGIRLGYTQPWLEASGQLEWCNARLVRASAACPCWSFAVILEKLD